MSYAEFTSDWVNMFSGQKSWEEPNNAMNRLWGHYWSREKKGQSPTQDPETVLPFWEKIRTQRQEGYCLAQI